MRGKVAEAIAVIMNILIGAALVLIGIYLLTFSLEIKNNDVESKGIIYSIKDDTGKDSEAYISYTVEGTEYKKNINIYIADMFDKQEVTIYYNPNKPEQMLAGVEIIVGLACLSMGTLIFLIGFVMCIVKISRYSTNKKLLKKGRVIEASIEMVEQNSLSKLKGKRRPYIIICRYIDDIDGKTYYKKSQNIWYDPQSIIDERKIKTLSIYLDLINPKKYYIPLDSISKKLRA